MQTAGTKLSLGGYLSNRSLTAGQRYALYRITNNFAQRLSRSSRQSNLYASPEKIHKFVSNFLIKTLNTGKIRPEEMQEAFCAGLREKVFKNHPDLTLERINAFVQESGVLRKLFDWGALNRVARVNFVEEAALLEAEGNKEKAIEYYKAAVEGYERGEGILADYTRALKALSHLEQGNPEWARKHEAEMEKLRRLEGLGAPEVSPSPKLREKELDEIKTIVINILRERGIGKEIRRRFRDSAFLAIGQLAKREDKDTVKELLIEHGIRIPLLKALVRFLEVEEIPGLVAELDTAQTDGPKYLAVALIWELGYREMIPRLIEGCRESTFDYSLREYVYKALSGLVTREHIPMLLDLLKGDHEELIKFAKEALVKVVAPEDLPTLYTHLETSDKHVMVAILLAIGKLGGRKDIARIEPYLGYEYAVALAAAESIVQLATAEDLARLKRFKKENMHDIVRGTFYSALEKLNPADKREYDCTVEEAYAKIWGEEMPSGFEFRVTEEDIKTDRWNVRKMLFDPWGAAVIKALHVIQEFSLAGAFKDLVEAFKFRLENFGNTFDELFSSVITKVAAREDLAEVEKMLSPDNPAEIKKLGAGIVCKLSAWQLIPQIRVLAAEEIEEAQETLLEYAAAHEEWATAYNFIQGKSRAVRRKAKEALASMANYERLPQLKEMLQSQELWVKEAGLFALEGLLKDKEAKQAEAVAEKQRISLGYNADSPPASIPEMLKEVRGWLKHPRGSVFTAALRIIKELDLELTDSEIEQLLVEAEPYSGGDLRRLAIELAARTKNIRYAPGIIKLFRSSKIGDLDEKAKIAARLFTSSDLAYLRRKVHSKNMYEVLVALKALARLGNQKDIGRVTKCLEHPENVVKKQAGITLAELATVQDKELIGKMLVHPKNVYCRWAAIQAATKLGLVEFMPLIRARFRDSLELTSPVCLEFFVRHGGRSEFELIKDKVNRRKDIEGLHGAFVHFATEKDLPYVEKQCGWGLSARVYAKLGYKDGLPEMQEGLRKAKSTMVRAECISALAKLGSIKGGDKEYILDYIKGTAVLDREDRRALTEALVAFWEESDVPVYSELVNEYIAERVRSWEKPLIYFEAMARKAPEAALELAETYGPKTSEGLLSSEVLEALIRHSPEKMLALARQKLREFTTPSGFMLSNSLWLEVLGKLGDEQDLPFLFKQLTHQDYRVQDVSAWAFAAIVKRSGGER